MVRSGLDRRRLRGSISTQFMAEAIMLTGTRRRLVEIAALVALGGSQFARPSSERGPDRFSHRDSTMISEHFRPSPRTWPPLDGHP